MVAGLAVASAWPDFAGFLKGDTGMNFYVNMIHGDGSYVQVHDVDCTHAQGILDSRQGEEGGTVPKLTPVGLWEEYNLDLIWEAEALGVPVYERTWDVDVYPCTGAVDSRTTVTGYPEG